MVISPIVLMAMVFLKVCIHVSRLIKMCTADICSVYVIKWIILYLNYVSIKQSLCFRGTGDGTQGHLHARQAVYHCATFPAQLNKAVF